MLLGCKVVIPKELVLLPSFLYPSFRVVEGEIPFTVSSPGLIFIDNFTRDVKRIVDDLEEAHEDKFVFVTSSSFVAAQYRLEETKDIVDIVANVRGIRPNKSVASKAERLDRLSFFDFLKRSIALGAWDHDYFERYESVYNLFKALMESKQDFIYFYYELLQTMAPEQIFSSLLTFIDRCVNYEDQRDSLSKQYRLLVKRGKTQGKDFQEKLLMLASLPTSIPREMRFLKYYLEIR